MCLPEESNKDTAVRMDTSAGATGSSGLCNPKRLRLQQLGARTPVRQTRVEQDMRHTQRTHIHTLFWRKRVLRTMGKDCTGMGPPPSRARQRNFPLARTKGGTSTSQVVDVPVSAAYNENGKHHVTSAAGQEKTRRGSDPTNVHSAVGTTVEATIIHSYVQGKCARRDY